MELHLILQTPERVAPFSTKKSALDYLLSRADVSDCNTLGATVFPHLLGLPENTAPAALSAYYDFARVPEGFLARADPAHLHLEHTRLHLFDAPLLNLTESDAAAFIAELNDFFPEEELRFYAPVPQRWYIRGAGHEDFHTHSLAEVRGADIGRYLPNGRDAKYWRARLNEIQMLLHQSPLNEKREKAGELSVNSVWLWGEGKRPQSTAEASAWRYLWHQADPAAGGAARFCGIPEGPLPDGAVECLSGMREDGAYAALLPVSNAGYAEDELEALWLGPLWRALRAGNLAKLYMYFGDGKRYFLTPDASRRWWRGLMSWTRPLSD